MTNANNLSESLIDLSDREREIVEYFVRGQKRPLTSEHLKLEFTETSLRLSVDFIDANGKRNSNLLGISKQTNQWQRKVLVSRRSPYRQILLDALAQDGFITKDRSSHPEFTEHHHYTFPDGYRLNYAEAMQLWRIWWHHKRYRLNSPGSPIDARLFNKGNWYPIEDLQPKQGKFLIQIGRGILTVEPEEFLVWIAIADSEIDVTNSSAEKLFAQSNAGEVLPQSRQKTIFSAAHPLDRRHPAKVTNPSPTDPAQLETEVDLESYLSTFNTEDSEDIDRIEGIYNIDELLGRTDLGNEETEPDPVPTTTVTSLPATTAVATQPTSMPPSPPQAEVPSEPIPALDRAVSEPAQMPEVRVEESLPNPDDLSTPSQQLPSSVQPPPSDRLSAIAPVSPPMPSGAQQQRAYLKRRALKVLAKYLQEGDRTLHTEVLKNAQGEEINRKTIEIRRGCPQWAIEQIIKLQQ